MYAKATDFQVALKVKELENKSPFSKNFPSLLLGGWDSLETLHDVSSWVKLGATFSSSS